MSFDIKLFSDKLKRGRENLQLSIEEIAKEIGMSVSHYSGLENGKLTPSGDTILILSDFFKIDYQYFISNQLKTAAENIQILYRKFGEQFSKEDRRVIQDFIYLCECEQFIFDLNDQKNLDYGFKPRGEFFKQHGIDAAKDLRGKLNLKPDELIKDIYYEFRKLGIHIFRRKLKNSEISGLFIMHPTAGKCILVNYDEDIYRQNFTIAHEVAHSIFDCDLEINVSTFSDMKGRDLKEIRANNFASNFLIPKQAVSKFAGITFTQEHIIKLAIQLKVNVLPLLISLKEAKMIDAVKYEELKSAKVPSEQKQDPELINVSDKFRKFKLELLEKGLSSIYVRSAYDAYTKGEISASRLSEMCGVKESELIEILKMFNLNLQYGN